MDINERLVDKEIGKIGKPWMEKYSKSLENGEFIE